jgi:hypothetical protein
MTNPTKMPNNLAAMAAWGAVPQFETDTPLKGGPGGQMNAQAQAIINSIAMLKAAQGVFLTEFMTAAQIADAKSGAPTLMHTEAFLAARTAAGTGGKVIVDNPGGNCVFKCDQQIVLGQSGGAAFLELRGNPTIKFSGLGATTDAIVLNSAGPAYASAGVLGLGTIDCNRTGRRGVRAICGKRLIVDDGILVINSVEDAVALRPVGAYAWIEKAYIGGRTRAAGRHGYSMVLGGLNDDGTVTAAVGQYITEVVFGQIETRGVSQAQNGGYSIYTRSYNSDPGAQISSNRFYGLNLDVDWQTASDLGFTPGLAIIRGEASPGASNIMHGWVIDGGGCESTTGTVTPGAKFINVDASVATKGWFIGPAILYQFAGVSGIDSGLFIDTLNDQVVHFGLSNFPSLVLGGVALPDFHALASNGIATRGSNAGLTIFRRDNDTAVFSLFSPDGKLKLYNTASGNFPIQVMANDHIALSPLQAMPSYANDAAASAGGVAVGELYRNGSTVCIRVA